MRQPWSLTKTKHLAMAGAFALQYKGDVSGENWLEIYLKNLLLDTKYKIINITDVMNQQNHLEE